MHVNPVRFAPKYHHKLMTVDDTEIAWAAGFFDGEGSIFSFLKSDRPNGKRSARITIVQKNDNCEVLDRFQAAVYGFGAIYASKTRNQLTYQVWNHSQVRHVMERLWKFLGSAKKEATNKAFAACGIEKL